MKLNTPRTDRMLNPDFKEFAGLLHAKGVEYLLVGGYALAAQRTSALHRSGWQAD